jgi:branched-chain amino acid transport system substrate-binding protein
MLYRTLVAVGIAASSLSWTTQGYTADFIIGVSGAMTGPTAGTYAPAVDAMRIYFDRLNAAGGIDGNKVQLILQDDQGEASKGAANAKKLVAQDQAVLLVNSSLSSTFAPMIAGTKRAGIPLLFAGSVCPETTYPPAEAHLFCTTAFAARYDSQATLDYIGRNTKGEAKLGLAAMAIPVSRGEIDYAEKLAGERGIKTAGKEVIPPPTPDYSPFATNLNNGGANWVYAWAPWVTEVKTLEALRKLGWAGDYITWAHLEAEGEAARLKDEKLHLIGATTFFAEGLPIHKEIEAAAKAANSTYPANKMAEGWVAAMTIEAALRAAGPGANGAKLLDAMKSLKVDTKGLRGGPIEWSETNHFRTTQYYRIYKWFGDGVKAVMDWKAYSVK